MNEDQNVSLPAIADMPFGVEVTGTALALPRNTSPDTWREVGISIARVGSASKWWLGDWWRSGEHIYGERKALVESEDWDGPKYETCKNAGVVAAAFERSRRRDLLTFNHHVEVTPLPVEWQDQLLDEAEGERLSIAKLRQRVKQAQEIIAQGWTPDQMERRAAVEAGRTVLANQHKGDDGTVRDRALLAWADRHDRLVRIDRSGDWGNPFVLGEDGDRATVIENFRWYIERKPSLLRRLPELRGKVLACWCCPDDCHGDVLVNLVNEGAGHGD